MAQIFNEDQERIEREVKWNKKHIKYLEGLKNKMKNKEMRVSPTPLPVFIVCVLLVIGIIGLGKMFYESYCQQQMVLKNQKFCEAICDDALKQDLGVLSEKDVWGKELKYSRSINEDVAVYTVRSAGLDGIFGNDDDMLVERKDHNFARIVSKWTGQRLVESIHGFKEGLTNKSKFEEDK